MTLGELLAGAAREIVGVGAVASTDGGTEFRVGDQAIASISGDSVAELDTSSDGISSDSSCERGHDAA